MVIAADQGRTELLERLRGLEEEVLAGARTAELLRQENHLLHEILDAIPVPIFHKDNSGRHGGANKAFEKVLGRRGPESADRKDKPPAQAIRDSGQVYELPVHYVDNSNHNIIFHKVPYTNMAGELAGQIGVLLDITDRRQAERKLSLYKDGLAYLIKERTHELESTNRALEKEIIDRKRAEEALREKNIHFRTLIQAIPDVVYLKDVHGLYIVVNKAFENIVKLPAAEIVGKTDADILPPDLAEFSRHSDRQVMQGGEAQRLEQKIQDKDGNILFFETFKVPFTGEDGRAAGLVGLCRDITEEKRIRQESEYRLQQMIQSDKLASLGEVVAGVAHEINNPNSFITYNIPLLEETWKIFEPIVADYAATHDGLCREGFGLKELSRDMTEIIQAIKVGSDRINKVVTDLKDFARLDESAQTKAFQVNEVVNKAYTIVGAQARKLIGRIDMNLADNLPAIQGHFQKLEQIVANLVVNAAQAIPVKEKGRLCITTRYLARLKSILIEVEDNGLGMDAKVMARIFEPFFTTRRDSGGTGLGLSVSYGLIQELNGTIGVLSKPGLGTRFTLYLPVDRRGAKLDLRPAILCVDDEVGILNLLKSYFVGVENLPFNTISSPEKVIDYLLEHPEVDIVLTDIVMPAMSGWDLLEMIKSRFPLLAVILYSGYPEELEKKPAGSRPDYLMEKPFAMDRLVRIFQSISRQRL